MLIRDEKRSGGGLLEIEMKLSFAMSQLLEKRMEITDLSLVKKKERAYGIGNRFTDKERIYG